MTKVWVISCAHGEYSDVDFAVLCAFASQAGAEAECARLTSEWPNEEKGYLDRKYFEVTEVGVYP